MATTNVIPMPVPLNVLESELLNLAAHITAAQCRFLKLLAEFDNRHGWTGDGIYSCAHWLSWRASMDIRTATEHLRVAHALPHLPKITEAFAAGQISYSKVRAITRLTGSDSSTLTRMAAELAAGVSDEKYTTVADTETAERVLLNIALSGTASHLESVVRAVRRQHTPPGRAAARRSLSWQWDDDGSLVVKARLTPEEGASLIAEIDALVPARAPITHPADQPPEDLDERATEQEPGPATDRLAARRADALLALVHGSADEESGPVVERGNAQVVIHFDTTTGTSRIAGGPEIPAATAERLSCDARVQILLDDKTNNRMYMGRARRLATPSQIAALIARDGERCLFPGCTHTRHLQCHHVLSWLFGGPTDIDNLLLICAFHHGTIHDHGYQIYRVSDRWEFRRPDGTPIPAPTPLSGNTESLIEMNTHDQIRITENTLTPHWGGERLDLDIVLAALLPTRIPTAA
ncbi:MAG: DUF222 domain-containing protein [Pseudonocardia sp.]